MEWLQIQKVSSSKAITLIASCKPIITNNLNTTTFQRSIIKRKLLTVLQFNTPCGSCQKKSGKYLLRNINPLKPELNPICYLLALLGAHHFLHVSRIRVKLLTFRRLMSYIYGAPILDISRSHTTTQHSR